MSEVVLKGKPAEYCWNRNGICLLRDTGLKAVVLEDLEFKVEVVLFARVFNFVCI
jgi:hypothetical protein